MSAFTEIGVKTWVQTSSRTLVDSRYYWVELRGSKQRESLLMYAPVNTQNAIREIAETLKLPLAVDDQMPDREPKHGL